MNSTQPIYFQPFIPSEPASFFSSKVAIFFVLNLFTGGLYGAAETVIKQHRVKKLEVNQEELSQKVKQLSKDWGELEDKLSNLIDEFQDLNRNDSREWKALKRNVQQLSDENQAWKKQDIQSNVDYSSSIQDFAVNFFAFFGHLVANILTVGLYGIYQNNQLKNRIKVLKAEHQHVEDGIKQNQQTIATKIDVQLRLIEKGMEIEKDLETIEKTPADVSRQQAVQAKQQQADLEKAYDKLKTDIDTLKTQNLATEQLQKTAEQKLSQARRDLSALQDKNDDLLSEKSSLENEKRRYQRDEDANKPLVPNLQQQIKTINESAGRVKDLQLELQQLQQAVDVPADFDRLKKLVGPIPPKYKQRVEDGKIEGALDYKQQPNRLDALEPAKAEEIKAYNTRYEGKLTAGEIIEAGFTFAFNTLIDMKQKGNKIQLVGCLGTVGTPSEFTVYRYMVLDWLKQAKLDQTAEGYEIKINEHVSMLPSEPEKVLRYKVGPDGKTNPTIESHYKRRDAFTLSLDETRKPHGANAVAAKWMFEQLSDDEKEHLFNLLMAPVIENMHADSIKTQEFMRDSTNPRVQLVSMTYDHIVDIGDLIKLKYGQGLFRQCWENAVDNGDDEYLEAFVKPEDKEIKVVKEVKDEQEKPAVEKIVKWELNEDIIGDKRRGDYAPRQPGFVRLMKTAREDIQVFYKYLDKTYTNSQDEQEKLDLLVHKEESGTVIPKLVWNQLNPQYYVSHHILSQYTTHDENINHHCLYANLLTVLVNDHDQITDQNVWAMKRTMANYLDKLQEFSVKWKPIKEKWERINNEKWKEIEKGATLTTDEKQIKEKWELIQEKWERIKGGKWKEIEKRVTLTADEKQIKEGWENIKSEKRKKIEKEMTLALTEDEKQIKEHAERLEGFAAAIKSAYTSDNYPSGWTIQDYQKYLRNEHGAPSWGKFPGWTSNEIEIAAHAFGVRICLLSVLQNVDATVNEHGLIVPTKESYDYYGPNTKETLYMAAIMQKGNHTYYGLFPRLKLEEKTNEGTRYEQSKENQALKAKVDSKDWTAMKKQQAWWEKHDKDRRGSTPK